MPKSIAIGSVPSVTRAKMAGPRFAVNDPPRARHASAPLVRSGACRRAPRLMRQAADELLQCGVELGRAFELVEMPDLFDHVEPGARDVVGEQLVGRDRRRVVLVASNDQCGAADLAQSTLDVPVENAVRVLGGGSEDVARKIRLDLKLRLHQIEDLRALTLAAR